MNEGRSAFKILIGNIRKDLKEMGINTRFGGYSVQDKGYWRALVNAALNIQVS